MEEIERAYTLHAQDVYRYLISLTHDEDIAEELTQETFFRAIRTIGKYDGSCKLSVWLCQVAKHIWYQYLDKRKRQNHTELTDEVQSGESPEYSTIFHIEKISLYKAIHSLPESMREVVHMRLTGEFSFAEIGEILGRNENWARTTFYRAKLKLMEELK